MSKQIILKQNHINFDSTTIGFKSYLETYLSTLNIPQENLHSIINGPDPIDADQPFMLKNMHEAVQVAYQLLTQEDTKVFVIVDSDCDGYTSSAILINYLKLRFPKINLQYKLHKGKEHGIILDEIPDECNLIFVPDAGTNDVEQQKALIAQNKTVIVLDHHELLYETIDSGAIIVNNQDSNFFPNKYLSGAGVTYLFAQAMDATYFQYQEHYANDFVDLAAIGIIADAMNMTTLGNNYFAYVGLSNIRNPFIYELAQHQQRGIKNPTNMTKTDVAFYIAPVINGVIRSGTSEDKEIVFKALITRKVDGIKEYYDSEWRGKQRRENLFEYAVRLATNAKSRQDSAKKKSFEWLCGRIRETGHDQDNLIIVTLDKKDSCKVSANITGLIAMELVKEFNRPCLVLRETEFNGKTVYGGSGRNGNFYGLNNLLDFLHKSGLTQYAAGHANAFGCFIERDKIDALREYAETHLNKDVFESDAYEVDYWFKDNNVPTDKIYSALMEFASAEKIWGNGIPRPLFAFNVPFQLGTNVWVMGTKEDSVKIHTDVIDFVSFKDVKLIGLLEAKSSGVITIVGSPSVNEWKGRKSIQVIIDDAFISDEEQVAAPQPIQPDQPIAGTPNINLDVDKPTSLLDLI